MMMTEHLAVTGDDFSTIDPAHLDTADETLLDALGFGVVGMSAAGNAVIFNRTEERYSGMKREKVLGQPFFLAVGVCMNNYLVAQRFEDEPELDAMLDYVLTFRMRPTPVKLRLLKRPDLRHRYLLVQR